jgi:hypothetical protein
MEDAPHPETRSLERSGQKIQSLQTNSGPISHPRITTVRRILGRESKNPRRAKEE